MVDSGGSCLRFWLILVVSKCFRRYLASYGFEKWFQSKSGWIDWIGSWSVRPGSEPHAPHKLEDLPLDAWRISVLDKEARLIQAQ
jgi:hypothetical protein